MKLGKRVKNGGSGHTGHIPEQFHDKVQTPVVALYIAVLTWDDIDVLELFEEELMMCGNNHLQQQIIHVVKQQRGPWFWECLDN